MFAKDSKRNRVERKVMCVSSEKHEELTIYRVAVALLRSHPFRNLPLHVRCFQEEVRHTFTCINQSLDGDTSIATLLKSTPAAVIAKVRALPPLDPYIRLTFKPSGYAAAFRRKAPRRGRAAVLETLEDVEDDLLDLNDHEFRKGERCWGKWARLQPQHSPLLCFLCTAELNTGVGAVNC